VREFEDTLTEVTARAGRAGMLPGVAAVRARGEQRRHRRRAGATALSVALLTGLAAGLLNRSVLTSAERTPAPPAHSGVLTPTPTPTPPTTSTTAIRAPRPMPATTATPGGPATDDAKQLAIADERRLEAEKTQASIKAAQQEAAAEQLKRRLARVTTTTGRG
jgi:hypothetical protein